MGPGVFLNDPRVVRLICNKVGVAANFFFKGLTNCILGFEGHIVSVAITQL